MAPRRAPVLQPALLPPSRQRGPCNGQQIGRSSFAHITVTRNPVRPFSAGRAEAREARKASRSCRQVSTGANLGQHRHSRILKAPSQRHCL